MKRNNFNLLVIILILAVFVFIFSSCNTEPDVPFVKEEHYNVILLMGQSNADGYCYSSYLPSDLYEKYSTGKSPYLISYSVIESNTSKHFVPVGTGQGGSTNLSGPEIGIAEELEANDIPALIIKWTYGGTNLGVDWLQTCNNGKCLYDRALDFIEPRLQSFLILGGQIDNICVCWMQGESDDSPELGHLYEQNLEIFTEKLKTDLEQYCNGNFYFIDACIQGLWGSYGKVNSAKKNFAAKHSDFAALVPELPDLITHSKEKTETTWGGSQDGAHFDTYGEYNLGREFVKRFIGFLEEK